MKTILSALVLAVTSLTLLAQVPPPVAPGGGLGGRPALYPQGMNTGAANAGSWQVPGGDEIIPANYIKWEGIDAATAVDIYAKLVNRTVLRGPLPDAKIILHTTTELTKSELIQAIEAVLAINNISVIKVGDKFLKVLPSEQANTAGAELDRSGSTNLPNLGSYITHIAQLHYVKPSFMITLIQPFAKLQGGLTPIDDNGILVMRDYAENIKRMLEMIDQIDISVPTEYVSEVIPIRYAKVDEIASALQSLGGGGGAVTPIGTAPSGGKISGLSGGSIGGGISGSGGGSYPGGGVGGGGISGSSPFGTRSTGTTANGTPTPGTTFQQRLNNILGQSGGGGGGGANGKQDIQLFGQTKIIPNESSSTLLIYATRQDMDAITNIIAKLDVPLAQVLIEAVIMDVTLGNTFNLGISAAQNPKSLGGNNIGGGGINNGQGFANFVQSIISGTNSSGLLTNATSAISSALGTNGSAFNSALPGGLSYYLTLGANYDVAVQAAESDSHANIIQRPRLLASQSKQAQFFVGETVPYVTSTYNNGYSGGYGGSSYSQLSVGVELDVTPFINPDGAVSMDIQQEIDDLDGYTPITGVGNVPNTIKRTLNTSITVRDRDAVMFGSFIKTDNSTSKSGVPFLVDIPLIGNLFSSRTDSKDREELIVLMRPTVLRTPEIAAKDTVKESQLLPGVSGAAAEDAQYQHDLIEAERKRELRAAKNGSNTNGFFNVLEPVDLTNSPAPGDTKPAPPFTPGTAPDPAPESTLVDPSGAAMDKAREQFKESSSFAGDLAKGKITPEQKKALDALLNRYAAGKITQEQYRAARDKILAAAQAPANP
jgi:general secretion pathway protein D